MKIPVHLTPQQLNTLYLELSGWDEWPSKRQERTLMTIKNKVVKALKLAARMKKGNENEDRND